MRDEYRNANARGKSTTIVNHVEFSHLDKSTRILQRVVAASSASFRLVVRSSFLSLSLSLSLIRTGQSRRRGRILFGWITREKERESLRIDRTRFTRFSKKDSAGERIDVDRRRLAEIAARCARCITSTMHIQQNANEKTCDNNKSMSRMCKLHRLINRIKIFYIQSSFV